MYQIFSCIFDIPTINWELVRNGALARYNTLCSRIQAGGIRQRTRTLRSTYRFPSRTPCEDLHWLPIGEVRSVRVL